MKNTFPPLSTLTLLGLCVPGLAQTPPAGGYTPAEAENSIPWPTAQFGPAGAFQRIVFGEFAGGVQPGALALVGDQAVYLHDPAVHDFVVQLESSGVNDLDAVAPAAPGQPAGMALALSDALWLYELDSLGGSIQKSSLAGGDFADLDLVRAGDVDHLGREDLVGVKGAEVRILVDSGSGWAPYGTGFTAPGTVLDVVLVDWDGGAGQGLGDVALLLDQSVEVREYDGTLIDSFLGVAPGGGFLTDVPPTTSNGATRLAWGLPLPPPPASTGDHLLMVLEHPGARVNCGSFNAVLNGLASAVYVGALGGTRVDLLTSRPATTQAHVFEHRTATPPYTAGIPQWTLTPGTTPAAGDGAPAFGDITFDDVPDSLFGRGATDEFVFLGGQKQTLAKLLPPNTWSSPILHQETSGTSWFGVTVQLPQDLQGFNHLQILLWDSFDGTELNRNVVWNHVFGEFTNTGVLVPGGTVQAWMVLNVADICDEEEFTKGYALSARLATWDGSSPTVSAASSALQGVFAKNQTTQNNLVPPDAPEPIAYTHNCGGPKPGIGYVPVSNLPPIVDNAPPIIPAVTEGPDGPAGS